MTITAKKIIEVAYEMLDLKPQNMKGCYTELSNENYHAIKSHLSRSSIMDFSKSPYTYWAKHLNPHRRKKDATPAMEFGTAFHTLILEPLRFDDEYCLMPEKKLLRDVGREEYDLNEERIKTIKQNLEEKIIISMDFYNTLMAMESVFMRNRLALDLIDNARIENSFFWKDGETGLLLKARPDILHDNIIVDLKTCSDASPHAFQREMVQYGYHVQGAMIRDAVEACEGRRINNVINICVETKYPHNMGIYIIDECAIDEGQAKYRSILVDIKNAIENNEYSDYGTQTIGLPRWAL